MSADPDTASDLAASTLEAIGDAVVTLDTRGVITSWNPAAEALFGHCAADMVGATLAAVIPKEFQPRHMAGFHAAMDSGALAHHGQPAHVEAITASGNVVSLAMTLGLLKQADGTVAGAVSVLRPSAIWCHLRKVPLRRHRGAGVRCGPPGPCEAMSRA